MTLLLAGLLTRAVRILLLLAGLLAAALLLARLLAGVLILLTGILVGIGHRDLLFKVARDKPGNRRLVARKLWFHPAIFGNRRQKLSLYKRLRSLLVLLPPSVPAVRK